MVGGSLSPSSHHCECHMPGAEGILLAALHSHILGFLFGGIHPCRADPGPCDLAVITTPAGDKGSQGTRGTWHAHRTVWML